MTGPIVATDGAVDARGRGFEIREWAHGLMEGPPLHVHHADDEAWHVLKGSLRFRFADRTTEVGPGATVLVPAGIAHTFGSPGEVRYLLISTPRVFALIDALHHEGHDPQTLPDVYRRHGAELLE